MFLYLNYIKLVWSELWPLMLRWVMWSLSLLILDFGRKKATRQRATVHSPKRIHGAQKTALVLDWLINLIFEHILYKYLISKRTIYYHERIQKFCSGEGGPRHTFGNFTNWNFPGPPSPRACAEAQISSLSCLWYASEHHL